MAKTISIALADHYAQGSTTLAWCWKATRKDGFVLAVTTCARDLLFEGVVYRSRDGFNPKAVSQEASAAVANSEVEGALSDDITELELEAGKWDGCTVELFEVNYRDLSLGKMRIGSFTMGDIKVTRSAFNAEMRGLTQRLQKTVGRVVTKGCPWKLGGPECKVALAPLTVSGTLTSVTNLRTFADASLAQADDYFGGGVLQFTSGANADDPPIEVYSFSSGQFVTHLPFLHNPEVGDTFTVTPGCRKNFTSDCVGKFANGNNFGGFPFVPGADKVIGLGGTEGTNL